MLVKQVLTSITEFVNPGLILFPAPSMLVQSEMNPKIHELISSLVRSGKLVVQRHNSRYFSHICDGTYMCRRIEEEVEPTVGLPRHRHFVGFFNVPVPTRDHPFYTAIPTHRPI